MHTHLCHLIRNAKLAVPVLASQAALLQARLQKCAQRRQAVALQPGHHVAPGVPDDDGVLERLRQLLGPLPQGTGVFSDCRNEEHNKILLRRQMSSALTTPAAARESQPDVHASCPSTHSTLS